MVFKKIIEKIKGVATEANDYEDVNTNIVVTRDEDGVCTEVTSDENT